MAKRAPHRTASLTGYLKRAPNRSKIDFICYFEGNCGCLETGGLTTTHRLMVNRSWCRCNDRMGARCAPKCPSFEPRLGGSNPRLGPYFRILTFSTAIFCYIQLASSSVVPEVPWDSHGELIVCIYSSQNQLFVHINPNLYNVYLAAGQSLEVDAARFCVRQHTHRHTRTATHATSCSDDDEPAAGHACSLRGEQSARRGGGRRNPRRPALSYVQRRHMAGGRDTHGSAMV